MSDKSVVVIIGAGLAGLAAGVYAQMNGYRSHIFEHHSRPGGVAAAWRRGDYLIDGGIHFLMGHRPGQPLYDLYKELGAMDGGRFLDMPDYGRYFDEVSGRSITITADLDQLAANLRAISPADGRLIDELIAGVRAMQGAGTFDMSMGEPPELASRWGSVRLLWRMRRVLRYFTGRYARPVSDYAQRFQDPWLRRLVANLFLPEVPYWFVLMLLALLAERQMGLLEEGCPGFVHPIERRYRELGGQVTYNATVEEILVEDGRAAGVRLADGTQHRAEAVISAADGHTTIFKMLGGRYADEPTRARYRDWQLIKPTFMVSYGVARAFDREPHVSMFSLARPLKVGAHVVDMLVLRVFNYSAHFAPAGKTVIQASFDTDWDYWHALHADRPAYEAEKARLAAEVLERLEAHYPGLSTQVEVTDVATPYTTWRYTLNCRGAYMGWLPTSKQLMTSLPRTLPGLADFYMAGQWVVPGGGVPISLLSGRDAVRILCKRDGKPFVAR
ncbi:MAG: hypothetical protein AUK03_03650 [Anaerolineae bacterium CG2_30_64_16]|nr:MAG: hypothetical protein AUK03_03650 [Anaerolineae bacterium CG2_30_64_16]